MGAHAQTAAIASGELDRVQTSPSSCTHEFTRNEHLVYEALKRSRVPVKAYDLLEELQDQGLRAPMTIYRALDTLIAMGHAKKIKSLNAFIASPNGCEAKTVALLVCRQCNYVEEIPLAENQVHAMFRPHVIDGEDLFIEAYVDCKGGCKAS